MRTLIATSFTTYVAFSEEYFMTEHYTDTGSIFIQRLTERVLSSRVERSYFMLYIH